MVLIIKRYLVNNTTHSYIFEKDKEEEFLKALKVGNNRIRNQHYKPVTRYHKNNIPVIDLYNN